MPSYPLINAFQATKVAQSVLLADYPTFLYKILFFLITVLLGVLVTFTKVLKMYHS
jgi:hypothetical protein